MTHKTSWQRPEAWIAVSNNRQKIYGSNKVYLDHNQEFQIELYNPTPTKYLAKIYLNGKPISLTGLVIRPGQRYFLDRFIDKQKKLVFSTYEVEDGNPEIDEAIAQNGLVKVEFFPEETVVPNWSSTTATNPIWYGSVTTLAGNNLFSNTASGYYGNWNLTSISGTTTGTTTWTSASTTPTFVAGSFSTTGAATQMKETGRVEEGNNSSQTFGAENSKFSWWSSFSSEYQILPRSTKPVETSEIRSYCPGCGTRVKKKTWKFCPSCGESLD